jgi:type II secretory pathway pseudopilin PulG
MPGRPRDAGYAMAALLVAISVMSIMLGAALPVWQTAVRREREAELVFRGEQYIQAITLFSRQTGGFPTSLNALRDGKYIRRLYRDPITDEDFQPVYLGQVAAGRVGMPGPQGARGRGTPAAPQAGRGRGAPPLAPIPAGGVQAAGPIIGVVSRSTAESIRQYNGRGRYNEWLFVSTAATQQAGGPAGTQNPGRGIGGRQGGPPAPGLPGRGGPIPGRGVPGRGIPGRGVPGRGGL